MKNFDRVFISDNVEVCIVEIQRIWLFNSIFRKWSQKLKRSFCRWKILEIENQISKKNCGDSENERKKW